jgi:hypothetical protein
MFFSFERNKNASTEVDAKKRQLQLLPNKIFYRIKARKRRAWAFLSKNKNARAFIRRTY